MNTSLLTRVQQSIARSPSRFCAAQWAFARNAEAVLRIGCEPEGFRCCIAGHVLLESETCSERELLREGGFHTGGELWASAAEQADISSAQGRELFFPSQWDHPFKQRYYLCGRADEPALAAEYIEHFLEKYSCVERQGALGAPERAGDRQPVGPSCDSRSVEGVPSGQPQGGRGRENSR